MTTATPIIGIDPGLQGALAIYTPSALSILDMPTTDGHVNPYSLADWLRAHANPEPHIYLEHVHSMPRQAGAFNFGRGFGAIIGVAAALDIPLTLVTPQQWKQSMGLRRAYGETDKALKEKSRRLATQLFPDHAHLFRRVKDDGRAEALLLALYGHHKENA